MEQSNQPATDSGLSQPGIVVYGTLWCAATQRVRRYLDRQRLTYQFFNIEKDQDAASQVKWWTGGYASHPTLQIQGDILIEPTSEELEQLLIKKGLVKTQG